MNNRECIELNNINYQSMLLNNNKHINKTSNTETIKNSLERFENILEQEKNEDNKEITWNKLNKMNKMNKLKEFAEDYCKTNNLNCDIKQELEDFLKLSLDRKRLQRVKDIQYDKKTGVVKHIPGLQFKKNVKKFTLKNNDKNTSTLKNLGNGKSKNKIKHIKMSHTKDNK